MHLKTYCHFLSSGQTDIVTHCYAKRIRIGIAGDSVQDESRMKPAPWSVQSSTRIPRNAA